MLDKPRARAHRARMSALTREEALAALESIRESLHARVPTDLPAKGRRYLHYVVDEQINAARLHLTALYQHGLAVGPGLTGLPTAEPHPKYAFWLEGIHRHIQHCEASLGTGRPGSAASTPPPGR